LLQPTEKIKDSYGKINTSLTNLNNNKLEKSGDTMSGELTVDYPNNGGFARIGIRNIAQTLDLSAYWEEGVTQFSQVQSWDIVGNTPRLLRLNPLGGVVSINDFEAWHSGNNPASLATNGYQIFASGAIVQHGRVAVSGNNAANAVTFPIVFPYDCDVVVGVLEAVGATVSIESITTSGFTARSTATSLTTLHYIAWGR